MQTLQKQIATTQILPLNVSCGLEMSIPVGTFLACMNSLVSIRFAFKRACQAIVMFEH